MEIYVQIYVISIFCPVFNHIDFTCIAASNTANDDVTN